MPYVSRERTNTDCLTNHTRHTHQLTQHLQNNTPSYCAFVYRLHVNLLCWPRALPPARRHLSLRWPPSPSQISQPCQSCFRLPGSPV